MFVVLSTVASHPRTVGRWGIPTGFSLLDRIHVCARPMLCSPVLLQECAAEQCSVQPGTLCITHWENAALPVLHLLLLQTGGLTSQKRSVKAAFSQPVELGKHFCLSKIHVSGYSQRALHSILLYSKSASLQKKRITRCLLSRCIISYQKGCFLSAEK